MRRKDANANMRNYLNTEDPNLRETEHLDGYLKCCCLRRVDENCSWWFERKSKMQFPGSQMANISFK